MATPEIKSSPLTSTPVVVHESAVANTNTITNANANDGCDKYFQQETLRRYEVRKNKRRFAAAMAGGEPLPLVNPSKKTSRSIDTGDDSKSASSASGRRPRKSKRPVGAPNYTASFAFNLPLVLTEEYHRRHQLSLDDFKLIFRVTDVHYLWMMALYNNFDITTSAIQSCHANIEAVTYSGNTVIVTKLLHFLGRNGGRGIIGKKRRFIAAYDEHRPPLPVHFVTEEQLEQLPTPGNSYDQVYRWQNIYVVPYRYYNGYLQLIRVVPRYIYQAVYGEPVNLVSCPFEFLINGLVYCGIPECLLVQTPSNHEVLEKLPENIVTGRYAETLLRSSDIHHLQSLLMENRSRSLSSEASTEDA